MEKLVKSNELYVCHDITRDNPNNKQVKIDRQNGYKDCLGCGERKGLEDFIHTHGAFSRVCRICKKNKIKVSKLPIFNINGILHRECTSCNNIKPLIDFPKINGRNKSGYHNICKICCNELSKLSYRTYKDKIQKTRKIWKENNKEKCREYKRKTNTKQMLTNKGQLNRRIGSGIRDALGRNKNCRHWETLVNFTLEELEKHLESKFTNNMNWEEFKKGNIQIDHILPRQLFEYESENDTQFKICWSLNNLQPLWRKDNNKKDDFLPNGKHARYMSKQEKLDYLKSLGFNL